MKNHRSLACIPTQAGNIDKARIQEGWAGVIPSGVEIFDNSRLVLWIFCWWGVGRQWIKPCSASESVDFTLSQSVGVTLANGVVQGY